MSTTLSLNKINNLVSHTDTCIANIKFIVGKYGVARAEPSINVGKYGADRAAAFAEQFHKQFWEIAKTQSIEKALAEQKEVRRIRERVKVRVGSRLGLSVS